MADLASLYIKVDSKGVVTASKDLDNLTGKSKSAEKATESVTRSFSKLQAVVVALASSYALLKMAQYVKDAALLAARYETLGVVMRVVGNNAGYTGAQMDKFARGLQKTGIAMVESRNTLARMIQAQIDLTSSQKLARIAQDAAVIGNINSSEAFERMIYGLQTGMPRILRTIGLNVDFQKSLKKSADTLGIKITALNEVQTMQARVNAVMKSGVLIQGTYEAAMGTAGKKLTSFIRYVDDFKVKMGEAFGPATVMLVDAATTAMKEFQDEISKPEAQKALRDLSSQLAIAIIQLGKDLPKAIASTTAAITKLTALYNSLPEGVVGAAGTGLIGRILLGSWTGAGFAAALYLITQQIAKLGPEKLADLFGMPIEEAKQFRAELDRALLIERTMVNQAEKLEIALRKAGVEFGRLAEALADPDKYYGEIIFIDEAKAKAELLAWQKEKFKCIKDYYKWIEKEAQENLASMIELEDEETRMIKENLAYRLIMQEKYYRLIEAEAREKRDLEEEFEDQQIRMARETAEYQKTMLNEVQEYWKHTFENIHDATADTFYDIFKNIEDGFRGLVENIKNWFFRLLAEMAAMALANPIKIIIGTVGGALGLPGMAEAGGGLDGSTGAASSIIKWINQSPFGGGSGALTQWGATWGNIFSYAAIAFNTINAIDALDKGNYGQAAGTAIGTGLGAYFGGPIGAAIGGSIGSFIGGIIDNIFGGSNAGFGSEALMSGRGKWGGMPSFGDWTQMPRAGGPAPTELIEGFEKAIHDTLQGMYDAIGAFSERMPDKIREKFEAALADIEINYLPELWGLTGANIEGSFTFALTREQAANLEEYVKSIPAFILDQIAPALQDAISEWAGTFDLTLLTEDNPIKKLYDEILEGVQDGDWEAYFEKVDAFMNTMGAVEEIWATLNKTVDNVLNPLSAFDAALLNINAQFDQWIDMLEQLGFTEEALAEVEAKRLLVLQKLIMEDAQRIIDTHKMTDYQRQIQEAEKWRDERLTAWIDLEDLMDPIEYEQGLADILKAFGYLLQDIEDQINKSIIRAQRTLLGTTDIGAIEDIAKRYGLVFATITEEWAQSIIDGFTKMTSEEVIALAASLGVSVDTLINDILKIGNYFDLLGNKLKKIGDDIRVMLSDISSSFSTFTFDTNTASMLMLQIKNLQRIPMSKMTPENLLLMSELLTQWYRAATAEEQRKAQLSNEENKSLEQVVDSIASLVDQIDQVIQNIKYSTLNVSLPYQKAEAAEEDYWKLYNTAQTGGTEDIQNYLNFVQTYLQQMQAEHKSSQAYQDIYDMIMGTEATGDEGHLQEFQDILTTDQEIYKELIQTHDTIHADLTAIQAIFSQFEGWILNALQTLEDIQMILTIDWDTFSDTAADALKMLMELVDVYGWENTIVLNWITDFAKWASKDIEQALSIMQQIADEVGWDHIAIITFIANIDINMFKTLDELAIAAGWIATESGGWNTEATITFLKNVAANWEFENIDEILAAIGWVKQMAGSWTADATISFIAVLMDRYGATIDHINAWLDEMGIMDSVVRREMEIQLIYKLTTSGDIDPQDIADWCFAKAVEANLAENWSVSVAALTQMKNLAKMFGADSPAVLGSFIATHSQYGDYTATQGAKILTDLYEQFGVSWARGGIVNKPTYGVVGEAGYPEAVIPMMDGYSIPVKMLNGGSNQQDTSDRPIHITVEVAGKEFYADIHHISRVEADNIRVQANRTKGNETRRLYR